MDASSDRAAAAEKRLDAIEAALAASPSETGATNPLARHLAELGAIKTAMLAAKQERDEAVVKSGSLAKENGKLKYQAEHLKRAVRENDQQCKAAASST